MGKIKVIKLDEKQKAELETGRQSIIGEMLCESRNRRIENARIGEEAAATE